MGTGLQIPDLSSYETFVNGFPHDAFLPLRQQAPVWWHEPTEPTPSEIEAATRRFFDAINAGV